MFSILFLLLFFSIFGGMISLAIRAAWSVTKILCTIVFWPLILLFFIFSGLVYIALPLLILTGLITLIKTLVV